MNPIKMDDIGEIEPMLNQDYQTDKLKFTFSNPFIYQQHFEYSHISKKVRKTNEIKLRGSPQIVRN